MYHFSNDTSYQRQYAWAAYFEPHLREIGIPCDVCGEGTLYPDSPYPERPLAVAVESGSVYPDILGCGEEPFLIVSGAVVSAWEQNAVTGYEAYPVTIATVLNEALKGVPPPNYFHIKVTGRCDLDVEAMGLRVLYACPKCDYSEREPYFDVPFFLDKATWDGSDLFISPLSPCVTFCTPKVLELAAAYQWSNFCFVKPEDYWEVGPEKYVYRSKPA